MLASNRSDTMQEPTPAAEVEETAEETKEELIERLLAKSDLDYKCCGSHCSA
jgi:hypothetical protein